MNRLSKLDLNAQPDITKRDFRYLQQVLRLGKAQFLIILLREVPSLLFFHGNKDSPLQPSFRSFSVQLKPHFPDNRFYRDHIRLTIYRSAFSMIESSSALNGVLVAIVTPFTDDGNAIHKDRLKSHIDHLFNAGCHGIVPGGSTGEFTALTLDERKQLTELCVEYTADRGPVVAGTGATSTKDCIELAQHAAKAGATALMVVPPFYDPVSYEQLQELMAEIYDASNLDIVYYNIPSASGLTLSPQEIAGLSKYGVKYLKDTSGNAPAFTELVFKWSSQITAFNGWDTLTFYSMAAGCKVAVWGASNIIPELSAQLWECVAVKGDLKTGRELWAKIFPICAFLESHNYSSAVKTGMELLGQPTGGLRRPFKLLAGESRRDLARLLQNAGLPVVDC